MSKGRRLITVLGIVLATAFCVRLGQARQENPSSTRVTRGAGKSGAQPSSSEADASAPERINADDLPEPSALSPLTSDTGSTRVPLGDVPEGSAGTTPEEAIEPAPELDPTRESPDPTAPTSANRSQEDELSLPPLTQGSRRAEGTKPAAAPEPQPDDPPAGVPSLLDSGNGGQNPLPPDNPPMPDEGLPETGSLPLTAPPRAPSAPTADALPDTGRPRAPSKAPVDTDVKRVQSGAGETNPFPPAKEPAGATGATAAAEPTGGEGFVLPADKLTLGAQSVGLSIQVLSPPSMNLHRQARVTIVVKNNGSTDAMGVVVRDKLPEGLRFVSSQPEAAPVGDLVTWNLGTVAAGAERKITLNVDPVQVGSYDHAATVFMKAGARAKTVVMQPRLKIEQTVSKTKVLKGQRVEFHITVTNVGDGPARDVVVRAALSSGLVVPGEGQIVELDFKEALGKEALKPHESLTLAALSADTVAGGMQSCEVRVISPDVVDPDTAADAQGKPSESVSRVSVEVTEAQLKMALKGSQSRFTNTVGQYTIVLENPGTAPAQDVTVSASLQGDGIPVSPLPKGAVWESAGRRIKWLVPSLEPKGKPVELTFQVRLGGVGLFQVNAEAVSRSLKQHASCTTAVKGSADLTLAVTESLRILDVGQETVFQIRVKNRGTREATKILVHASFSKHLEPKATSTLGAASAVEEEARLNTEKNELMFPVIDRLAPGADMTLEMKVKATTIGLGTCHVFLTHDDLDGGKLESVATTKVTGPPAQP